MITLVDYGLGNLRAFANVYKRLDIPCRSASTAQELRSATKLILPGVGAFDEAMARLEASGMRAALEELVLGRNVPVLGICVGMQILAGSSEEGRRAGLGWIPGSVRRFETTAFARKNRLPHMGWNSVQPERPGGLFESVDAENGFYFLHSYYFRCDRESDVLGRTDHGGLFASAVNAGRIYGVQFHPEKSHGNGVQLLKNFWSLS